MYDTSASATHIALFARLSVVAAVAYQLLLITLILGATRDRSGAQRRCATS
jgi:hypothetical protein